MTHGVVRTILLLIKNEAEACEIGNSFKKLNFDVQYFTNLSDLQSASLQKFPYAVICDVTCVSQGTQSLFDQIAIKAGTIPLILFYEPQTKPLVVAYANANVFGVLQKEADYTYSIGLLVKRLDAQLRSQIHTKELELKIEKLETSIAQGIEAITALKASGRYNRLLQKFRDDMKDSISKGANIYSPLANCLDNIPEIQSYAYWELNLDGTRLINAQMEGKKLRSMGNLWLGTASKVGISPYIQQMAVQASSTIMDGDLVVVSVMGHQPHPIGLLIVKSQDEFDKHFDWDMFESILTQAYMQKNSIAIALESSNSENWFDFFASLDSSYFDNTGALTQKELLLVDTKPLVDIVRQGIWGRFNWRGFALDLRSSLQKLIGEDVLILNNPYYHVIAIEEDKFRVQMDAIRKLLNSFPLWRFFSNYQPNEIVGNWYGLKQIPRSFIGLHDCLTKRDQETPSVLDNWTFNLSASKTIEKNN